MQIYALLNCKYSFEFDVNYLVQKSVQVPLLCSNNVKHFNRFVPWSSDYGERHTSKMSWVRIFTFAYCYLRKSANIISISEQKPTYYYYKML